MWNRNCLFRGIAGWGVTTLLLLALALSASGCFLLSPSASWMEASGSAVRQPWGKTGEARLQARHEAVEQARKKIWDALLVEKVDLSQGTLLPPDAPEGESIRRVEFLVMTNVVFASRLRALVGALQPLETLDGPDGEVDVRLRMDHNKVLYLVSETVFAMRVEERL